MGATSDAAALRARIGHPVIDADGHLIETAPVFKHYLRDYVRDIGGGDLAARIERVLDFDETVLRPWSALSDAERRGTWATRPPWWSHPAKASLDRATGHLPRLMYERLDELGNVKWYHVHQKGFELKERFFIYQALDCFTVNPAFCFHFFKVF